MMPILGDLLDENISWVALSALLISLQTRCFLLQSSDATRDGQEMIIWSMANRSAPCPDDSNWLEVVT